MNRDVMLVLFQVVVLVFALSVHGCVQAWATMRRGDPTAYMMGRVSLNPAKHLDPWGSVVIPVLSLIFGSALVGWGKPTPVTLRNFKKVKRDDILSTLSGLFSYLALAIVALVLLVAFKHMRAVGADAVLAAMMMANRAQVDMTQLPALFPIALLLYDCVVISLLLFVFNLIPVPPLDASRLVRYALSYNLEQMYDRIGMLGSFLMFFVAAKIVFPLFYPPLINGFNRLLLGL